MICGSSCPCPVWTVLLPQCISGTVYIVSRIERGSPPHSSISLTEKRNVMLIVCLIWRGAAKFSARPSKRRTHFIKLI